MQEDKIKEAFSKVREDIENLYYNYQYTHTELQELKELIKIQNQEIKALIEQIKRTNLNKTDRQTEQDTPLFPVDRQTDTSTYNLALEAVKLQNSDISTGNKGVSTDRQTHRQTDNTLNQIPEVLESLTKIREEVRIKFNKLTRQELIIFSIMYQLEEQGLTVDYNLLSQKLQITESSIRDHIGRIIKKGIPIEKYKENNKKIILKISKNLKEIASLETIQKLRDSEKLSR